MAPCPSLAVVVSSTGRVWPQGQLILTNLAGQSNLKWPPFRVAICLPRCAPIRGWVGPENQQLALALDFTGDFDRLGDEIQELFVHRLAVAGEEQEIEREAVRPAHEQH